MSLKPRTEQGRRALAAFAARPARALVCTDFDGVLSPIVSDPDAAWSSDATMDALARLARLVGRVAVVTGRPARQAVRLGRLERLAASAEAARLEVRGLYGLERWDAATGTWDEPEPPAAVHAAASEVGALLAGLGLADARVEDKRLGFAVHTRELPDPADALARLAGPVRELAERHGLHVQPGRHVLEVRAPGGDKGDAIRALVGEHRPEVVVAIGDDLGDVPAFEAVAELRDAGRAHGLLVCARSDEQDALVPLADLVVQGPAGVAELFDQLADAAARAEWS